MDYYLFKDFRNKYYVIILICSWIFRDLIGSRAFWLADERFWG